MTTASTHRAEIKKVVFIENDALILEAIREILASQYEVSTAQDGLEGISLVRKIKPDYIILDVVIPKLDGGMVCAAVRKDPQLRNIPIIVFSSLSPTSYKHFPLLSADAYVAKGPLASAGKNILEALRNFEEERLQIFPGPAVGFEDFQEQQMDKELLQERAHFAAIVQAVRPGILELDTTGRILMANSGAIELLRLSQTLLVGNSLKALLLPTERKVVNDLVSELKQATEPVYQLVSFHIQEKEVTAILVPVLEERSCTAILVLLQSVADVSCRANTSYGETGP